MFDTLKKKYYRWKARFTLTRRYEYLNEVNNILEEYITAKILEGGNEQFLTKGRQDLINKQAEIKETSKMIEFLRALK